MPIEISDHLNKVSEKLDKIAERNGRILTTGTYLDETDDGTFLVLEYGIGIQSIEVHYKSGDETPFQVMVCSHPTPMDESTNLVGTAASAYTAAGLIWGLLMEEGDQLHKMQEALDTYGDALDRH